MEDKKLKEKLEEGHILARIIIDVVGKPKEHVENSLRLAIKKIKEQKNIILKEGDLFKAKEKEGLWSTFSELELLFKDAGSLVGFCFDYVPSSVEILEPKGLRFDTNELSNLINDFLAKLHQIGVSLKKLNAENQILNKNATALLRNMLVISLKSKDKTLKEIADFIAIPEEQLKPFIDVMVRNNLIKKEGNKYKIK